MAITIRHKLTSLVSDAQASGYIKPSNWNDTHDISAGAQSLIGNGAATSGTAADLAVDSGDFTMTASTFALKITGATAGSYTNANITVDSKGRIVAVANGSSTIAFEVSTDLSPQLGGDLDLNGFNITGSGDINITGSLTLSAGAIVGGTLDATTVTVDDDAYAAGWNGSAAVPTKNAVYDKIELMLGTTLPATYQPLDSDLTAIAALTTTTYGRSLLTLANATALAAEVDSFFLTPAEGNAAYQPLDADLTSWAGVTRASGFDTFAVTPSSANLRALLSDETGTGLAYFQGGDAGTPSAIVLTNGTSLPLTGITSSTSLSLGVGSLEVGHATDSTITRVSAGVLAIEGNNILTANLIGSSVQAYDSDLASWAGVTRASGFDTFAATPTSANLRALMSDETGTGVLYFAGGNAGTPSAIDLTNGTNLSLTTGVTGDLPFSSLAQGAALSVLGVSGNATADVASIAAGSDSQVLRRSGTAVGFGAVDLTATNAVTGTLRAGCTPVLSGAVVAAGGTSTTTMTSTLTVVIGDGTNTITTGVKGFVYCPYAFTITEWTIVADASGSIVIDIWSDVYANGRPTVADTITASAKPTLSAANAAQSSTLTGWTTSVPAGNFLGFNVDSITTCKQVTLTLKVTKTG